MTSTKERMQNFFSDCYKNLQEIMIGVIIISFLLGNLFFFLDFKIKIVFTISRLVLIASVLYCAYQFLKRRREKTIPRFLLGVWIFFLAWFLYGIVWLFFSAHRGVAFKEISCLGTNFGLMFCLGYLIDTKERVALALKCLKFCGVFLSILMIVQLFTGIIFPCSRYTNANIVYYMKSHHAALIPTTMFNNENDMAAFLILIIALYFSDLLFSENRKEYIKTTIKLSLIFFSIVVINSTITLIALGCMFVIGLVVMIFTYKDRNMTKRLCGKTIISVADLGIFYAVIGNPIESALRNSGHFVRTSLSDFFVSMHMLPTENFLNSIDNFGAVQKPGLIASDTLVTQLQTYTQHKGTIFVRLNLIIEGFKIWTTHVLFGIGPNSFETYMQNHKEARIHTTNAIDPHNFWIEILSQYGIVIFIPFVILYVMILTKLVKIIKNGINKEKLGLFLAAILFFFSVIIPSSSIGLYPVWVVFAVIIAGISVYGSENSVSVKL
ncbi:MAG TPA: O-antigen ligase family protein [Oscillospiraceae bacterium]|nr:O-antigen ligase family protein [Oscillospiraceae bacterium]